jgi:ribonuclease HII
MNFVLGADEAGYGPKLGPLCVAASAWEVPDVACADQLYDRLAAVVTTSSSANGSAAGKLAIADSKRLYKPGGSLALLEAGVLTALAALDRLPGRWREIWGMLDGAALAQIDAVRWHAAYDEPLPRDVRLAEIAAITELFRAGCQKARVRIADLQATVLFPSAFNAAVSDRGNKAEVLSLATLQLVRRVLTNLPAGRAIVLCDKHGGRSRYAALLQHIFPDDPVRVRHEAAALGVYEVQLAGRPIEFRFQPRGEQHLPTALASMTAKYLRELAMRPFNEFWRQQVPGLKPTAGYPTDAQRFHNDIASACHRLAIANHLLWRDR